jgi:hypothetical protein
MLANHEPDRNIEELTDADIYAAIHYLEPDEISSEEQNHDDSGVVICVCLYITMSACLAFLWLYWK